MVFLYIKTSLQLLLILVVKIALSKITKKLLSIITLFFYFIFTNFSTLIPTPNSILEKYINKKF